MTSTTREYNLDIAVLFWYSRKVLPKPQWHINVKSYTTKYNHTAFNEKLHIHYITYTFLKKSKAFTFFFFGLCPRDDYSSDLLVCITFKGTINIHNVLLHKGKEHTHYCTKQIVL